MDAMQLRTPKLRIVYAISLLIAFASSISQRTAHLVAEEQLPLVPESRQFRGLGTSTR